MFIIFIVTCIVFFFTIFFNIFVIGTLNSENFMKSTLIIFPIEFIIVTIIFYFLIDTPTVIKKEDYNLIPLSTINNNYNNKIMFNKDSIIVATTNDSNNSYKIFSLPVENTIIKKSKQFKLTKITCKDGITVGWYDKKYKGECKNFGNGNLIEKYIIQLPN